MKAIVYTAPMQVSLQEVEAPQGAGVLVQVDACGICGTDLTIFKGAHPRATAPLVLGHEFIGHTAEDCAEFPAGTRVTCYPLISCGLCQTCLSGQAHICDKLRLYGIDAAGGMADQVRIPASELLEVDPDVPDVVAAQAEPLAVCIHAARRVNCATSDHVAIIGAGPIGTTLAAYLRRRGVGSVALFDTNEARIKQLRDAGFDAYAATAENFSAALSKQGCQGFDTVFECAGAAPAVADALRFVRTGGKIAVVSIHKGAQPVDLQALAFREIEIIGTRVYTRDDFAQAVHMLAPMQQELSWLGGETYTPEAAPALFRALVDGTGPLKAIIAFAG